jgi:hypothetical protein
MIPTIAAMAKVKIELCLLRRLMRAFAGSALISVWLVHLFDLSFFIFILVCFVSSLTFNTVSIPEKSPKVKTFLQKVIHTPNFTTRAMTAMMIARVVRACCLSFIRYNIPQDRPKVKRFFKKVIHNET